MPPCTKDFGLIWTIRDVLVVPKIMFKFRLKKNNPRSYFNGE